jgi:ectoine hydroxylase-related dioxygenase (phytanoyl-CoA dioxygenase family)
MIASDEGLRRFADEGFAICRGVIGADHMVELRAEADRLRKAADRLIETAWVGPVRWLIRPGCDGRPVLRGLQYPYRISAAYDRVRTHPMVARILFPLIGTNLVSTLGTLFWKPAGFAETVVAYHQDSSFRKPAEKFRNLATSYVQVGIALDPNRPENGGIRFVVGSHKGGDLQLQRTASVMAEAPTDSSLWQLGFTPDQVRDIEIDAGDVVIWHAHTLHGSPPNRSRKNDRLFYVLGYMRRADADEGDPAFVDGQPCSYSANA